MSNESQQHLRSQLQKQLGYQFQDPNFLDLALSHRSVGATNNERLEFLGDSILNFVIATQLFERCGDASEGHLSRLRASLVKGDTLAEIGRELGLGEMLRLGAGELKSGGHKRGSIIADAVEAVLGAIMQDSGFDAARAVVETLFSERLQNLPSEEQLKDPKTRLQEWLQAKGEPLPDYELEKTTGKAHQQTFHVRCSLPRRHMSELGEGTSRRKAEQDGAAKILAAIAALEGAG